MTDQDELESIQTDLTPLAFQKYIASNTMASCVGSSIHAKSYNVTKACKQVHNTQHVFSDLETLTCFCCGRVTHCL